MKSLLLVCFSLLLCTCQKAGTESPDGDFVLDQNEICLIKGEETIIEGYVYEQAIGGEYIRWHSSDSSVVSVSRGKLQAKSEGSAVIVASFRGLKSTCQVSVKRYESFWLSGISGAYSDMVWVRDYLIGFGSSSDDLTKPGSIYVNEFDTSSMELIEYSRIFHKWGHCNTVDYNPNSDCLILGNGSGDYHLPGKIIVIPTFSDVIEKNKGKGRTLTLEDVHALVIDCEEYCLGGKFNVVWGSEESDEQDSIYLISTDDKSLKKSKIGDMQAIRRIGLCKGSLRGEYGMFVDNPSSYNGTFRILKSFSQRTSGYDNCNQGSCVYKDELFTAVGHDGLWFWRMSFTDTAIIRKSLKLGRNGSSGSVGNASGICVRDGFVFIGSVQRGILVIDYNEVLN